MVKKKLMAACLLLLVPFLIIGCSSGSEGTNNSMTSISGTVTVAESTSLALDDGKTNNLADLFRTKVFAAAEKVLPKAKVKVKDFTTGELLATTMTNNQGQYQVTGIEEGTDVVIMATKKIKNNEQVRVSGIVPNAGEQAKVNANIGVESSVVAEKYGSDMGKSNDLAVDTVETELNEAKKLVESYKSVEGEISLVPGAGLVGNKFGSSLAKETKDTNNNGAVEFANGVIIENAAGNTSITVKEIAPPEDKIDSINSLGRTIDIEYDHPNNELVTVKVPISDKLANKEVSLSHYSAKEWNTNSEKNWIIFGSAKIISEDGQDYLKGKTTNFSPLSTAKTSPPVRVMDQFFAAFGQEDKDKLKGAINPNGIIDKDGIKKSRKKFIDDFVDANWGSGYKMLKYDYVITNEKRLSPTEISFESVLDIKFDTSEAKDSDFKKYMVRESEINVKLDKVADNWYISKISFDRNEVVKEYDDPTN